MINTSGGMYVVSHVVMVCMFVTSMLREATIEKTGGNTSWVSQYNHRTVFRTKLITVLQPLRVHIHNVCLMSEAGRGDRL